MSIGLGYIRFLVTAGLFGLLAVSTAVGQQPVAQQPAFNLDVDSVVSGANGDIIGLTVALANDAASAVAGQLHLVLPDAVRLLGSRAPGVQLAARSRQYLPVKLQVNATAAAGQYPIVIQWTDTAGHIQTSAQTMLHVLPKRAVWLQALNANELMRQVGDSLSIRVLVRNGGNTAERVRLVVSTPNQQGGRRFLSKELELPAAIDTTVVFGYLIDQQLIRLERFTVNIAGLYVNEEVFGNTTVNVQNASASRRYEDPARTGSDLWSYRRNYASFIARNPFDDNRSWQLNGQGSYHLAQGRLDFSAFAYQWGAGDGAPVLHNTWVNFERNNNGVTIGNIAENLETFVNGRGVKVYFADSLKSEHLEIGLVDQTFDLLGSDHRPDFGNGFTAYVRTRLGEGIPERKRYIGTAIYERKPYDNSESFLYMSTFDLLRQAVHDKVRLVADFGPALTRPLHGAPKADDYRPAAAGGIHLHANFAQFTVSSTNYYSTGYYPGIRRGALQLNQRISRPVKRSNVWAGYSLYEYAPRYFESQSYYRNDFLLSRAEMGVSFPLNDFVSLSLVPLHEYEKGNYFFGSDDMERPDITLNAYRLNSTVNWRSRDYRQYAYLQLEGGLMQSSFTADEVWQLRTNLSYNYAWFNMNANLQRGSLSLIEAANNSYFGRGEAYRIGVSASARRDFIGKRVQTEAGLSYYDDSFSGRSWSGNARVQYVATKKTSLFLLGQLYQYNTAYYPGFFHANIQVGIHQALPTGRENAPSKRGAIELFLYRDANHNGIFDDSEAPAANTMVMIDGAVFITGNDGKVTYNRVPYGSQEVRIPVQQGWYAPPANLQLAAKRLRMAVGLQQVGTVGGSVRFQFDARVSFAVDAALSGFTITAKSTTTDHVARAMTDAEGNYLLYLPAGNYEFTIMDSKMPQHVYVEEPIQHVVVEAGQTNAGPVFVLKVEEKQVEIKRFSSP